MFFLCEGIREENPSSLFSYICIILAVVFVGLFLAITSIKMLPKLCKSRPTGKEGGYTYHKVSVAQHHIYVK